VVKKPCVPGTLDQVLKKPDPIDLPRLLRLDGERCGKGPGHRGQQEAATIHYSIT